MPVLREFMSESCISILQAIPILCGFGRASAERVFACEGHGVAADEDRQKFTEAIRGRVPSSRQQWLNFGAIWRRIETAQSCAAIQSGIRA